MADKLSERLERIARDQVWGAGDFKALDEAIELARRVEEADSMQVWTGPCGFGEIVCMPSLIGQRVRLVPEPPEVG